jgi:hypothetical protein
VNRLTEARRRLRAAAAGNDGKELADAVVEYVDARESERAASSLPASLQGGENKSEPRNDGNVNTNG